MRINPEVARIGYCYVEGCTLPWQVGRTEKSGRQHMLCSVHGAQWDAEEGYPALVPSSRVVPYCVMGNNETSSKVYHYTVTGPIEPIHVIDQYKLGFRLGSALKYLLRADHKGQRDSDLEKAINFLWRERYGTWRP